MHILTGLLLTRILAGNRKESTFKGFKGVVEIQHLISGRVRYRIPILKNEPKGCNQLKSKLEQASQLTSVQANPINGSVLVHFKEDEIEIETLTGVIIKILGLEKSIDNRPSSFVSKELKEIYKSLDNAVFEYTNGVMDLNSFVTSSFLTLGILSILRNRGTIPSGLSLLYWAYMNMQQE
jgi:hypothetical protein